MAKIGLTEGLSLIPKGTHVFQIVGVNYKEDFGKMEVTMKLASGQKHEPACFRSPFAPTRRILI